jgi:hypothetical protein
MYNCVKKITITWTLGSLEKSFGSLFRSMQLSLQIFSHGEKNVLALGISARTRRFGVVTEAEIKPD